MARLCDLKVGQTVWIKKGHTSPDDFDLAAEEVEKHIGKSYDIGDIDADDEYTTIHAGPWWWPADWISLTPPAVETPPKGFKASVSDSESAADTKVATEVATKVATEAVKGAEKPTNTLYVAHGCGTTTTPGTLIEVLAELKDVVGITNPDYIQLHVQFYEVKKVDVQYTPAEYTPAKFEVL